MKIPQHICFDETALPRSWQPEAIMPGSFDDEWVMPARVRRAPTPWAKLAPPLISQDDDDHDDDDHDNDDNTYIYTHTTHEADNKVLWALPLSPVDRFVDIHVTLDDIAEHATHQSSRASPRSISASSTSSSSLDSISTLLSSLNDSIASWQSTRPTTPSTTSTASTSPPSLPLRRRRTPRTHSLRDMRTKQSDMQLQRAYELSMQTYLDASVHAAFRPPPLRPRNPARLLARNSV